MEYKRLTIRNSDGSVSQPTNTTIEKVFYRLAEFEDKIEQGLMVELPRIIHPNKAEWYVQYQYSSGVIQYDICFSEEEAEARLKELQNK